MSVSYKVELYDAFAHIFQVTCSLEIEKPKKITFTLPDWIPGSYMIREFSKNITEMKADVNGTDLAITQIAKSEWSVNAPKGKLTISSKHYAFDYSVRTCFFDQNHAYFNGTSLFFHIQEVVATGCFLEITKNSEAIFKNWMVASSLQKENVDELGFGLYRADNYDDLIDHPVEIAQQSHAHFEANGIPHDIYIQGKHDTDLKKLTAHLKTICEYELNLFSTPYPIDRYVFLFWVMEDGYGGLEHNYSTSLMVSRKDLINSADKNTDEYIGVLGLCSHEYFHTWNVKRLKPKAYNNMSLNKEAYTRLLWWFEGVTSYFDDLMLLKSGLIELDDYLKLVSKTFNRVLPFTGREKQSIADSSLTTWNKFYKQDENAQNGIVSYYAKGAMVAMALDLNIQQQSNYQNNLEDLLLHLWTTLGATSIGIDEFQIENILKEHFGLDLDDFFTRYIYGTEEPNYIQWLNTIGIDVVKEQKEDVSIGAMTKNNDGYCQLTRVLKTILLLKRA